jgi:hypothetical protein
LSTNIAANFSNLGFWDVVLNSAGTLAVVAAGTNGVLVVDLTNPAAPFIRGSYDTPGIAYGIGFDSSTGLLYVADGSSGLKILSLSNPNAPSLVGSLAISGAILRDVAVSGGYAYCANQQGTLEVVKVSTPSSPMRWAALGVNSTAYKVAVEGTRAVLMSANGVLNRNTLVSVNVSNPASPVLLGTADAGPITQQTGVALSNGLAYAAATTDGLKIFNLPASNPVLLDQTYTIGNANGIVVQGSFVYTAGFHASMSIFSLSAQ